VDLQGGLFRLGPLEIDTARLHHPQGATAYRLAHHGRVVVFATDTEFGDPECDAALRRLAADADVLIHDAQYSPGEYEVHRGQGHSTWQHAVAVARSSGAKKLVLFHHDPHRTDEQLELILAEARVGFPDVYAAREGDTIEI
jgi:ribonuclease BN (tRNA processing enzyme)